MTKFRRQISSFIIGTILYLVGVSAYILPVLSQGIRYENPFFSSTDFFKITTLGPLYGLGLPLFASIWISLLTTIIFWKKITLLWKILSIVSVAFFCLVYISVTSQLPGIILQLQFGRALPYISITTVLALAGMLNDIFKKRKISFFISTIIVIATSYLVISSIEVSSSFTAAPTRETRLTTITDYLKEIEPTGSVFIDDVSKATYLTRGDIRFSNSYNEHLLPSPLSMRIRYLIQDDATYSSLSTKNMKLLDDYITVLGIEYILLRPESPLEVTLQYDLDSNHQLEILDRVGDYTVFRNTQPIHYSYLVEKTIADQIINKIILPKPTLSVTSYDPWDAEISKLAQAIRSGEFIPQTTQFQQPDKASIILDKESQSQLKDPLIFTTLSYDPNWSTPNVTQTTITPTSTRFMLLDTPRTWPSAIALKNSWPWWHWPLQALPYISFFSLLLGITIHSYLKRKIKQEEEINIHLPYNLILMKETK